MTQSRIPSSDFCVWNLPILCLSKIGGKKLKVKLLKIRKILDLLSNRKIVHRNYWLVVFFLLRFSGAKFVTSLIFKRFLSNIWSWACENWSGSLRTVFECRDIMACFDLKGRVSLAFKNFPCRIAKKFYCVPKIGKISKIIRKILDFLSNRKIWHRNYWLSCALSIKIFRGRVCFFFNF